MTLEAPKRRSLAIGRSAAGAVIGYVLMLVGTIVATAVTSRMGLPLPTYLTSYVASACVFAAIGGYIAAVVGRHRGTLHGSIVAVLIVALALLAGPEASRNQPTWYPAVLTFSSAVCAVFGGYLCSRLRRSHSAGHFRAQ